MESFIIRVIFTLTFLVCCDCLQFDVREMTDIVHKCQKEAGMNVSIELLSEKKVSHEAKCFYACVMKEKHVIRGDGTLDKAVSDNNIESMLSGFPDLKDRIVAIKEECWSKVNPNPNDLCEESFLYFSCQVSKGLLAIFEEEDARSDI